METAQLELFDAVAVTWRACRRCQMLGYPGIYPTTFFPTKAGITSKPRRGHVCLGCEDDLDEDRLLRKSLDQRVRRHARNFGLDPAVYRARYGMTSRAVLDWFKRIWATGTLDCGCKTENMNHGWRDAEIDRHDPYEEPFFPDNWRLTCSVHNNSKLKSKPADFAARQHGWRLWKEARGAHASQRSAVA